MTVKLRDYQAFSLSELRRVFRTNKRRACLVAPTGAGKTTIAAELIRSGVERGNRIVFIAHRTELIEQAAARLDQFGVDLGVIKAGTRRAKPRAMVQVASVQTLINRQLPPAKILIFDECHRILGQSYLKVLAAYPEALVVGLTATPIRLDGKGLGDVFDELVVAAKISDLVARGVLVKPRVYVPSKPDLSGVKRTAGDFNQADLAMAMDRPHLVGDLVEHWQRLTPGRKTVVFASGVEHSRHIVAAFQAAGVRAAHLDGNTPADDRAEILADLTSGKLTLVSNVAVLTEGWDCPTVEVVVLARPTESLALYLQMVGRGIRSAEGKTEAFILDHAGCTLTHGLATDDRDWALHFDGKKQKPGAPSLKNCPSCYAVCPTGCAICPECQYAWERVAGDGNKLIEVVEGQLVEYGMNLCPECKEASPEGLESCPHCGFEFRRPHWLDRFRPAGVKPTQDEKQRLYTYLKDFALRKDYKKGWASHQYKAIMGVWPTGVDDARPWPGEHEGDAAPLRPQDKIERFKGRRI